MNSGTDGHGGSDDAQVEVQQAIAAMSLRHSREDPADSKFADIHSDAVRFEPVSA
ncbi:hypothetical protein AB4305_20555 [Nocardia sp. 2YAB30]|uniref:hypothetical protein n=1 Tax=unclassified Nocardia TaxID=2637762 RepID=UPI003F952B6A